MSLWYGVAHVKWALLSVIARVVEFVHQTMREVIQPLVREVGHLRRAATRGMSTVDEYAEISEEYEMDWVDPTASASQEWQWGHHSAWRWERSWWSHDGWWTVSEWGQDNWSQYGGDTDDLWEEDDQMSVTSFPRASPFIPVSIPISDMGEWS